MIAIFDDFLPSDQFQEITKAASVLNLWKSISSDKFPMAFWFLTFYENYQPTVNFDIIDKKIYNAALSIESFVRKKYEYVPEIYSMGILNQKMPYFMKPHYDVPGSLVENNYIALYNISNDWQDGWGGESVFAIDDNNIKERINPKPNRLIVYSIDERHQIYPILPSSNDNFRRILRISFIDQHNLENSYCVMRE